MKKALAGRTKLKKDMPGWPLHPTVRSLSSLFSLPGGKVRIMPPGNKEKRKKKGKEEIARGPHVFIRLAAGSSFLLPARHRIKTVDQRPSFFSFKRGLVFLSAQKKRKVHGLSLLFITPSAVFLFWAEGVQ